MLPLWWRLLLRCTLHRIRRAPNRLCWRPIRGNNLFWCVVTACIHNRRADSRNQGDSRKACGSRNPDLSVNGLDSVDEGDLFRFGIRCGICLGFEDGALANHLFPKGCLDI